MRSLSDPFPRIILHLDMDAFFASVEQMDHPEWRGKPVIIGGETRGVVSTASYEARRFGVHSAMPMTTARRLCPQAIFVRGNRRRYVEISGRIMAALQDFSPLVEPASIDEAYLDATGLERLFGPVEQLIPAIKARVREVTGGLTCSVAIICQMAIYTYIISISPFSRFFCLFPSIFHNTSVSLLMSFLAYSFIHSSSSSHQSVFKSDFHV